MPRPGTRVVPDGWEAHHAPTAEGAMTATCTITRPVTGDGPYYSQATGRSTYPTPATVYTGQCRIQATIRPTQAEQVGEKPTAIRRYRVSIPLGSDVVQVNDLISVTAATDPTVVGARLRVVDIAGGSLLWQHDLICTEHEATTR